VSGKIPGQIACLVKTKEEQASGQKLVCPRAPVPANDEGRETERQQDARDGNESEEEHWSVLSY
jgi:hypothetical protein